MKKEFNIKKFLLQFFQHFKLRQSGGQLLSKLVAILAALETESRSWDEAFKDEEKTKV